LALWLFDFGRHRPLSAAQYQLRRRRKRAPTHEQNGDTPVMPEAARIMATMMN
jgi:hypothetical protein